MRVVSILISLLLSVVKCGKQSHPIWDRLNLPPEHIPFFFNNHPEIKEKCALDPKCNFKDILGSEKCWGYEDNCLPSNRMSTPVCPEDCMKGWAETKEIQIQRFWEQADYGYIRKMKDELTTVCEPVSPNDSLLECVKHTRFCRAKNIYMDFTQLNIKDSNDRFREDVFKPGQIGGHCKLNKKLLASMGEHKSPLQSWYRGSLSLQSCVNMFHHFCDYVNLYAAQHMNSSIFNQDVQIIMWDTKTCGPTQSPYSYGDFFSDTWKVFTDNPVIPLKDFDGKKVCFQDAVFPFLPRMRFGLYYNMPLIPGCYNSGLVRSFSQHVLHRLQITQQGPLENKVRVTLLDRGSKYRMITNQKELVAELNKRSDIESRVVEYHWNKMPFLDQLQVTYNSDIFIGMHGAGLTHTLFLPDWAVAFELYHCDDKDCYYDLARLRGVKYMTWENMDKLIQEDEGHHPTLGAHKKFTNYAFDVDEFMRLLNKAIDHVTSHSAYKEAKLLKHGTNREEL